jgi:hypothetical protein
MLSLDDEQMSILLAIAAPIPLQLRPPEFCKLWPQMWPRALFDLLYLVRFST